MKKVIVVGASGLVGSCLVRILLEDKTVTQVVALLRNPLSFQHSKLIEHVVNFDDRESVSAHLYGDVLFCCLGTTKKKTPDPKEYRKIDYGYPKMLASIASEHHISQFHLISSIGADSQSVISYSKIKGDLEKDVKNFKFKSLHIYQPSILDGDRKESRLIERVAVRAMRVINHILAGPLKKYRSIKAETVAHAMVTISKKDLEGIYIYPSDKIKEQI